MIKTKQFKRISSRNPHKAVSQRKKLWEGWRKVIRHKFDEARFL